MILPQIVYGQEPIPPERDTSVYYGFYNGAAGIIFSLLDLYTKGLINSNLQQPILSLVKNSLDSLWSKRVYQNGIYYPIWQKIEYGDIYSGIKYGTAGIIKGLVEAYKVLKENKYLSWAEAATNELLRESNSRNSTPNWSYDYYFASIGAQGIPITDYKYGSLGIIDSFIDVYKTNNNQTLLSEIVKSANWLKWVSKSVILSNQSFEILPWYYLVNSTAPLPLSYEVGNSGAIKVFNRLTQITNDNYWVDWGLNITRWLMLQQGLNGDFPLNMNQGAVNLFNLDQGTIGIALGISQNNFTLAQSNNLNQKITNSINKSLQLIYNNFIINSTSFLLPELVGQKDGRFGFLRGQTGLVTLFESLFNSPFLSNSTKNIVTDYLRNSTNYIINYGFTDQRLNNKNYVVSKVLSSSNDYTDLSFANGLAGILYQLGNIYSLSLSNFNNQMIKSIINKTIPIFLDFHNKDFLWPKQINYGSKNLNLTLIIISGLFLILLILLIIRKRITSAK